MSTEQEQLARFSPALDALERDTSAQNIWELQARHVDILTPGTCYVLLSDDGSYQFVMAIEPPEEWANIVALPMPEEGYTNTVMGQLRAALKEAVFSPDL